MTDRQTKKNTISRIRAKEVDRDYPKFMIKRKVSEYIINDMKKEGKFIETDTGHYYWFHNEITTLYQINKSDNMLGSFINNEYGINATEPEYRYVVKDMEKEAIYNDIKTKVQRFAFYDHNKHCLYLSNEPHEIYKLDGREINKLPNGSDGVFFLPDTNLNGIKYKRSDHKGLFKKIIIENINFVEGERVNLDKEEQGIMLELWFYSLFFESIQPTKPILVFVGPFASGKTSALRKIGTVLFGCDFNVSTITNEGDFDATISNSYFTVFDNVDDTVKWLNDRLAHTATGKVIEKRQLYTTNKKASYKAKCFICLTSHDPKFKRPDVVSRLLLFRVDRLKVKRSESSLLNEILSNRDDLMSEIMDNLNRVITHLRQDNNTFESAFRMADWAEIAWKISKATYDQDKFAVLLEKMGGNTSEFLLEDNPIFECLNIWIDIPGNEGRVVQSAVLHKELKDISEDKDISFDYENPKSFGKQLRSVLDSLKHYFDIKDKQVSNCWKYKFKKRNAK